jgi:hypothetical protein
MTEVAEMIERHANLAVDWFLVLLDAHRDPTASPAELRGLDETALTALDDRLAALRADLLAAS